MRPASSYRSARRNEARRVMAKLREENSPRNWRAVWAATQAAHALARDLKQRPQAEPQT